MISEPTTPFASVDAGNFVCFGIVMRARNGKRFPPLRSRCVVVKGLPRISQPVYSNAPMSGLPLYSWVPA
jgi:hypothetical protein